jgi:hypothetical protein
VQRFKATLVAVFVVAVVLALVWVVALSLTTDDANTAGLDGHLSIRLEAPVRDLPRLLG